MTNSKDRNFVIVGASLAGARGTMLLYTINAVGGSVFLPPDPLVSLTVTVTVTWANTGGQ